MKEIIINDDEWDLLNIMSCITYDDILYNKLHDNHIKVGDKLHLDVEDKDLWCELLVKDIEYCDGTIWFEWLGNN
jgi:hypothetical protein